jgi:hypothetical protein
MTSPRKHDFSPTPSEVLRYFLVWLRGFHENRERSKAADWAMVVLTLFTLVAAIVSAWFFQEQLIEARRSTDAAVQNFRVDERAWVEIEAIKTVSSGESQAKYRVFTKNVGKTAAHDVTMRLELVGNSRDASSDSKFIESYQDESKPPLVQDLVPKVLAPNAELPVPLVVEFQEIPPQTHYFIGRIDYVDEFKVAHWIRFCYFATVGKYDELLSCGVGNYEDHNPETSPTAE